MLTKQDLLRIEDLFEKQLEVKLEEKFKEKLKFLPTKHEFYAKMDEVMFELKAIREEQELITGRNREVTDTLENHEIRIKKLESPSSLA